MAVLGMMKNEAVQTVQRSKLIRWPRLEIHSYVTPTTRRSEMSASVTSQPLMLSIPSLTRFGPLSLHGMAPLVPRALVVALAFRGLSLALPHTFFQPDEFFQAFEPAFASVFGHGYLTWEWRDLPVPPGTPDTWWTRVVVGGRLRGWIWPGLFALVYQLISALGLACSDMMVRSNTVAPHQVLTVFAGLCSPDRWSHHCSFDRLLHQPPSDKGPG